MSTLIGVLLDVSASMQSAVDDLNDIGQVGGTWIRSIFTVIDNLVKYDVSRSNYAFIVGVGAPQLQDVFDIISTVLYNKFEKERLSASLGSATDETIERILQILQKNGACTIRQWAKKGTIKEAVSENIAISFLRKLRTDGNFLSYFVYDCLPKACRDGNNSHTFQGWLTKMNKVRQATVEEIQAVVDKAFVPEYEPVLKSVSDESIFNVSYLAYYIHGNIKEENLTPQRAKELLKDVEPFIYGTTPLYSALRQASELFLRSMSSYPNHQKLLFILSDGRPTDNGDIHEIKRQLAMLDVQIVGCYISKSLNIEPRRLYSSSELDWEDGAKFLFSLSTYIPTNLITRAVFIKHGWQMDIANNETKLFLQINHPDNLQDVCDLARNAVCCQDALTELLASVSLDVYINQRNTSIKAHEQIGETCYANASATVLHLAMHRILGRDGGYPDFEKLRDDMIGRHGSGGANTFRVLEEVCPIYRLHCREVDVNGALKAISAKRPIVAKFRLTDDEWNTFGSFFRNNSSGILKKEDLDISARSQYARTSGHAVVLTSYNSKSLCLMNSWGENWGDMGFFRVENTDVLGLEFIDVFWTLNDLSQREKDYYRIHGSEVAEKLMKSLKGFQVATFTCPLCKFVSNVTDFSGTVSHALCPKCNRTFLINDGEGNILVLNIYLTSLSR